MRDVRNMNQMVEILQAIRELERAQVAILEDRIDQLEEQVVETRMEIKAMIKVLGPAIGKAKDQ